MAAKRAPAKKKAAKKKAPATKQAAAKKSARSKAPATKAATKRASKRAATKQPAAKKPAAKRRTAERRSASSRAKQSTTQKSAATRRSGGSRSTSTEERSRAVHELPKPRFNKDGFGYTKDFDLSFVKQMYELLQEERVTLTGQAKRLEDEAHQLVEEAEMGDVQFDDEGGEGDTMVVERERDLALSAQARETVLEIDAAIDRIMKGTYGYSIVSGRPIPRERLEAIPWSAELVEEKVGGIGRR